MPTSEGKRHDVHYRLTTGEPDQRIAYSFVASYPPNQLAGTIVGPEGSAVAPRFPGPGQYDQGPWALYVDPGDGGRLPYCFTPDEAVAAAWRGLFGLSWIPARR